MMSGFLYSLLWIGLFKTSVTGQQQRPHVIFIVADDIGWNDVSWHNGNINTPNLEKLVTNGILLNSSYTHATCSPSRAAFLTGYYPYHLGLQHSNVRAGTPTGVPQAKTFLPQKLKTLGYENHIVGKWHLGYCNWNYTPTYRGFDSFYGYYNSGDDYYTHRAAYRYKGQKTTGLDFTFNKELIRNKNGSYSTHVFTDRAISIISNHPKDSPLFLYLPFQAAHGPLQVPDSYSRPYRRKVKKQRAVFAGMVTAIDEAVGKIVEALKETQMWNNTLLIFTNDNGGAPASMGNNYPLRGGKFTFWEGGVRSVAFIHGQMLNTSPYVYDGLFHAVDWFPTILSAVDSGSTNTTPEADSNLDGINHWQSLTTRQPSPREEFVYNIDQVSNTGAIRLGDFKLLVGSPGDYDGWYKPGQKPTPRKKKNRENIFATIKHPMLMLNGRNKGSGGKKEKSVRKKEKGNKKRKKKRGQKGRRGRKNKKKPASIAEFYNRGQARQSEYIGDFRERLRAEKPEEVTEDRDTEPRTSITEPIKRSGASLESLSESSQTNRRDERSVLSAAVGRLRLFNIRHDPEERKDLSEIMPEVVKRLYAAYQKYEESAVPVRNPRTSPLGDPRLSGDAFVPGWC